MTIARTKRAGLAMLAPRWRSCPPRPRPDRFELHFVAQGSQ